MSQRSAGREDEQQEEGEAFHGRNCSAHPVGRSDFASEANRDSRGPVPTIRNNGQRASNVPLQSTQIVCGAQLLWQAHPSFCGGGNSESARARRRSTRARSIAETCDGAGVERDRRRGRRLIRRRALFSSGLWPDADAGDTGMRRSCGWFRKPVRRRSGPAPAAGDRIGGGIIRPRRVRNGQGVRTDACNNSTRQESAASPTRFGGRLSAPRPHANRRPLAPLRDGDGDPRLVRLRGLRLLLPAV